jgi:hypothetical protein
VVDERQLNEAVSDIMDGDPFFESLTADKLFRARQQLEVALRAAYRRGYRQAEADDEQAVIADLRARRARSGGYRG